MNFSMATRRLLRSLAWAPRIVEVTTNDARSTRLGLVGGNGDADVDVRLGGGEFR